MSKYDTSARQNYCKRLQIYRNMGYECALSFDLGYVFSILSFPLIICGDKTSGTCKILSQSFSKNALYTETLGLPAYI